MKAATETALVNQLLGYLGYRGILAWRNNTGAAVQHYKGKKRVIRFGAKGSPDILGVLPKAVRRPERSPTGPLAPPGILLGVEAKRPGEKPTPDQQAALANLNARGAVAVCVHSLDELAAALDAEGY